MSDKDFLEWLWNRLSNVYGEDTGLDFMHKLKSIANATPCDKVTPNRISLNGE